MSELEEAVSEAVERARESGSLGTIVALLVALAATFVAVASVKDRNLTLGMMRAQAKAVDTWNYYQAKSMKQNLAEATLDQLRAVQGAASAQPAAALEKRIASYEAQVARYEKEKEEVKVEAEGYERQYEVLEVRHDQFDLSDAAMAVAIALLGVTALTRKRWLLGVAAVFLAVGVMFGVAAFLNWNLHADKLVSFLA
jgi:hypothetical protein